jgi:hypothetical protein
VFFYARAEDRNEPGSNGQRDGDGKDRLFVNVFTVDGNPASSVILVSQGTNPTVVDPLIITTGNLQIHISSCDVLPAGAQQARQMYGITEGGSPTAPAAPNGTWGRLKVMYR